MTTKFTSALRSVANSLLKRESDTHRFGIFIMPDLKSMRVVYGPRMEAWVTSPNSDPEHRLVEVSRLPDHLREAIEDGPEDSAEGLLWIGFGMGYSDDNLGEEIWPGLAYETSDCEEAAEAIAVYLGSGTFPELLKEHNKVLH